MKKKEIKILVGIAISAIVVIVLWNVFGQKETDPSKLPSQDPKGQWVAIVHRNKIVQWFDSGIDGEYTVTGDYGDMVIEVKDGKWHVKEVECPNHTCEGMGWDDGNNIMPITCIPNNIMIGTEKWAENYISNE